MEQMAAGTLVTLRWCCRARGHQGGATRWQTPRCGCQPSGLDCLTREKNDNKDKKNKKTLTLMFPPIRSGGSSSASRATLMVAKGRLAICCISLSSCCGRGQGKKRSRRSAKVSDLHTHKTVNRPNRYAPGGGKGGGQG